MQERTGNDAVLAHDWSQIIRARLKDSVPRHAPADWIIPGRAAAGSDA
jgi:hypothetical protein